VRHRVSLVRDKSLSGCVFFFGVTCGYHSYRDCSPPPLQPSQPPDQGIILCNPSEWLGPQSKPVRTLTVDDSRWAAAFMETKASVYPVRILSTLGFIGHLEGVTKPKQAGQVNGVHTEVFRLPPESAACWWFRFPRQLPQRRIVPVVSG